MTTRCLTGWSSSSRRPGRDVFELLPGDEAASGAGAPRFRLYGLHDPAREFPERLVAGAEQEHADAHPAGLDQKI